MAKGKKKSKGGGGGDGTAGGGAVAAGVVADFVNNVAGQAVGQLVGDALQRKAPGIFGGPDKGSDATAKLLMILAEQGPKSVAELIELADAPVQTLLDALAAARRAKLVGRIDKLGVVRITDPGCQVAVTVRKKVEEQGRASAEESTSKREGG